MARTLDEIKREITRLRTTPMVQNAAGFGRILELMLNIVEHLFSNEKRFAALEKENSTENRR
ncbi:hypothetical protein [Shimazuella alba]|jgi:hypothetical protein|uniref:Uncharacterized protein n=1 Tax=Shimazuella alba TaxID=2690964 RepID=A0A6I4VST6_9BACL|nr:hypothetical protein [Shimazuella alba]MXQ54083.1 hypothetical protein [Shimazuella alba]